MKIGQVGLEIIGLRLKGFYKNEGCTPTTLLNSRITGQNLTKFLHNVATSAQMNFLVVTRFQTRKERVNTMTEITRISHFTSKSMSASSAIAE